MRMRLWVAALAVAGASVGLSAGQAPAAERTIDAAFLTTFHQGSLTAIAMGNDAPKRAVSRCVKDTAAVLVRDNTRLDKQTTELARRLNVTLPASPTVHQQNTLKDLAKNAGTKSYDADWLKDEKAGNTQALKLLDKELANGKNRDAQQLAKTARPLLADHLTKVQECLRNA